jgi:signal peptide peptidase SppA
MSLLAEMVGQVWAMDAARVEAFLVAYHAAEQHEAAKQAPQESYAAAGHTLADGFLTVRIAGPMIRRVPSWLKHYGIEATGTEQLLELVREATDDGEVEAMHLEVDSPGGVIWGIEDLSDLLFAFRERKQLTASVRDSMASAAYWVGSQADAIDAGPGAAVGSIGVYTVLADVTGAWEKMGVKVHVIRSHELKGIGVGEITDAQVAEIQRLIDGSKARFVEHVARGRQAPAKSIDELATGQVWIGADALERGLVDTVSSAAESRPATTEERMLIRDKEAAALQVKLDAAEEKVAKLEASLEGHKVRADELAAKLDESEKARAKAEAEVSELKGSTVKLERQALLTKYEKRITPAQKASVAMVAAAFGDDLPKFEAYLAALPEATQSEPVGQSPAGENGNDGAVHHTEAELELMRACGLSDEQIKKAFEQPRS